jgi:ATP-binding cassette subfamily B protein IrtB
MTAQQTVARRTRPMGDRRSALPDPLMLRDFRPLLSTRGRRLLRASLVLECATGVLEGLSLLALLPLSTALAQGSPAAGLGVGGWLTVLLVLAIAAGIVRFRDAIMSYSVATDFLDNAQRAIGDRLTVLPLGWFTRERAGRISRLVSDGTMAAGQVLAEIAGPVVAGVAALVTLGIGSWFWDWRLGLALTASAPLLLVVLLLGKRLKSWSDSSLVAGTTEVSTRVVEYAACQGALRAAGRSDGFAPLREACRADDAARRKNLWWSSLALLLNGSAGQWLICGLILLAAQLATSGALGAIQTIAFIGIALRFAKTLDLLGSRIVGVENAREPLEATREIMTAPTLPQAGDAASLPSSGRVELEDVVFGYDPQRPVLRGVSLDAAPGTMTAIVGPSGSGKTTIVCLVARFWDADGGSVRVGGADLRDQPTPQLMDQISMVFQDVYLLDDTLEANVRLGRRDASDAEVREAAELAGVSEIAARLPEGWASRVGEGGRALSGGERQRVSIARALLKRAPVVLLDEATSALDAENEAHVLRSVEHLRENATLLVIAHKLDTVQKADQIVVLGADGTVRERGRHEELLAHGSDYRRFWDRRVQAAGWTLGG